jgi:hypothetical protein
MKSPFSYFTVLLLACLASIHAADALAQPAATIPKTTPAAKQEPFEFDKQDSAAHVAYFLQNRKSAAADPFRPLYHFSPPGFGLHDVAGLCKWQGQYHLFYQNGTPWETTWTTAISQNRALTDPATMKSIWPELKDKEGR